MRVVAISGAARSGSTFFSLLLSKHPDVFNLGQLRHLWRSYENAEICSCGESLRNCSLYGDIVPEVHSRPDSVAPEQMHALGKAFIEDADRRVNWSDADVRRQLSDRHKDYLAAMREVIVAVAARTGCSVMVDTSKDPATALAFDLINGVELFLLNLVRDPRAVAVSWQRRKGSARNTLQRVVDWKRRQSRLEEWRPALAERFLTLRYEDLAAAPAATIQDVAERCNIPLPDDLFVEPDHAVVDWGRQHLYPPANEHVLAAQDADIRISVRESWQDPKYRWIHVLTRLLAGKQMRDYYRE
jgi:hypothetical protein